MHIKVGERLRSAVDTTEIVIIRAEPGDVALTCGGQAMVAPDASVPVGSPVSGQDTGTALGKRYTTVDAAIEVLCTKAGQGSLSVDGVAMTLKQPRGLPASD
ncbi:hypothetical protein [Jatrophihabitans sp.]|uniref:hypothetical protein n=1 Tax=Jatrophihabitans sp. TaxID=1932789 RepID=UPI0030C69467